MTRINRLGILNFNFQFQVHRPEGIGRFKCVGQGASCSLAQEAPPETANSNQNLRISGKLKAQYERKRLKNCPGVPVFRTLGTLRSTKLGPFRGRSSDRHENTLRFQFTAQSSQNGYCTRSFEVCCYVDAHRSKNGRYNRR